MKRKNTEEKIENKIGIQITKKTPSSNNISILSFLSKDSNILTDKNNKNADKHIKNLFPISQSSLYDYNSNNINKANTQDSLKNSNGISNLENSHKPDIDFLNSITCCDFEKLIFDEEFKEKKKQFFVKISEENKYKKEFSIVNKSIKEKETPYNKFNIKKPAREKFHDVIFPIIIKTPLGVDRGKLNNEEINNLKNEIKEKDNKFIKMDSYINNDIHNKESIEVKVKSKYVG